MSLIKEKIHKILHDKYKRMYLAIISRAHNVNDYGKSEDKMKFVDTIINQSTHPHIGFISESDRKIIEMLEYLVDEKEPVR